MAIARSEGGDALTLDDMPDAAQQTSERQEPGAAPTVLSRLRDVWSTYVAENKRGWSEIVDEQSKDPTLG